MNALQECLFVSAMDEYRHGQISGRELVRRARLFVGDEELADVALAEAGFSAAELWTRDEAPVPPQLRAQGGSNLEGVTIRPDDPSITVRHVSYTGEAGTLMAYLARPREERRYPGVVVIHENKGLVEHIKDVARRLAKAGYVDLAPDLLSREGGTDHFTELTELQSTLMRIPPEAFMADLGASLDHLKGQPFVAPDRLGATGFCFGGGLVWRLSTKRQDLKATVPFYGAAPPAEDVPNIKAVVLAIYGELDQRINAGIPALEVALIAAGIRYEKIVYPGAAHAFHNDTGPNYHPEAARDAWARALAHLDGHLKGASG